MLDGSLTARERARVTEHLAGCESCYEIFAGTVHLLEDSRDEQLAPAAPLRPFERPRKERAPRQRLWWAAAALAAMLAVTAGLLVLLPGARGAGPSTEQLASLVGSPATTSLVPWRGRVTRGLPEEPATVLTDREAFRLGVRFLDLWLALDSGDREGAREALRLFNVFLNRMDLPSKTGDTYKAMAKRVEQGGPLPALADAAAAEKQASDELQEEPRLVELGRWTEACRLAGASGRAGLFRERGTLRVLDRALAPAGQNEDKLEDKAAQDVRAIRDEIAAGSFHPADLGKQCEKVLRDLDYD